MSDERTRTPISSSSFDFFPDGLCWYLPTTENEQLTTCSIIFYILNAYFGSSSNWASLNGDWKHFIHHPIPSPAQFGKWHIEKTNSNSNIHTYYLQNTPVTIIQYSICYNNCSKYWNETVPKCARTALKTQIFRHSKQHTSFISQVIKQTNPIYSRTNSLFWLSLSTYCMFVQVTAV